MDPVTARTTSGAEVLADIFYKTKLEYSAMNTARSALSSLIEPTHGLTFGNQPLTKRLLRGIFKERLVIPRHMMLILFFDFWAPYLSYQTCPLCSYRNVWLLYFEF